MNLRYLASLMVVVVTVSGCPGLLSNLAVLGVDPVILEFDGRSQDLKKDVFISNKGAGRLDWQVTIPADDAKWITATPQKGTGAATISIQVFPKVQTKPKESQIAVRNTNGNNEVAIRVVLRFDEPPSEGQPNEGNPPEGEKPAEGQPPVEGEATEGEAPLEGESEYERGFNEGFARDDWYWKGYDDSCATTTYDTVYYQGGLIPVYESPLYDAGYYDGVWYAYNNGYYVAYDVAFTIGFSEGYDLAFNSGAQYASFIVGDTHIEYDNGGWADGYNDGYSEGKFFGGDDYRLEYTFDWIAALDEYWKGTDIFMPEINQGTGAVMLYMYGYDPNPESKFGAPPCESNAKHRTASAWLRERIPAVKASDAENAILDRRVFDEKHRADLEKAPEKSPRSDRTLSLKTTWLERINAYYAKR